MNPIINRKIVSIIFMITGLNSIQAFSSDLSDHYSLENHYERTYQEFARVKYDLRYIQMHKIENDTSKNHWLWKHKRTLESLQDQYIKLDKSRDRQNEVTKPSDGFSKKYNQHFEICPNYIGRTPLESHFLTTKYSRNSCVYSAKLSEIKILENEKEAFNLKVKALLGRELPAEMLRTANPYMSLDFSKAPKLKEILISALVFEKDFSGVVITRLLEHHAEKGVNISVIVANPIVTKKSKKNFAELMNKYKNLKVKFFRFNSIGSHRSKTVLSKYHKVNHIKIFSVQGASVDSIFIGGRNIHDGFLFDDPIDHSDFPELTQRSQKKYSKWVDMDLLISNKKLNKAVRGQFKSFWNINQEDMYSNITSLFLGPRKQPNLKKDSTYIRHFISVPYSDQLAHTQQDISKKDGEYLGSLEKYKVDLIDSASRKIKLVSPYLNLTDKIYAAFERAIDRGVEVQIITRINLEGDTVDALLTDVNKSMINRLYKKVDLYEYLTPRKILHSKIMLVDGQFTVVGSVNYNKRSFVHDTENFVAVWSKNFHNRMDKVFETYKLSSKRINEEQKASAFNKFIINSFETYF